MAKDTDDKNETKAADTKAAKPREPKAGDDIRLVLGNGLKAPAKIEKVAKNGLVDLLADVNGEEVQITSSPRDDSGTLADSWHFSNEA